MIGLVLAAGTGRRLRPDTETLPTALLPVAAGTTILDIALHNLAAAGLTEVVVVTGHAASAIADRVAGLERAHGLTLTLVHNARAGDWHNAYSLWLAREYLRGGALLVNGDTVHPARVGKTLLAARHTAGLILAIDELKPLGEEEMKVMTGQRGLLAKISRQLDPASAHGEYIGATLIEARAAGGLADALEASWRCDPGRCYEASYQVLADLGWQIEVAPIGAADWVKVDDHDDLKRGREIAATGRTCPGRYTPLEARLRAVSLRPAAG